jgi:hypothetical protein
MQSSTELWKEWATPHILKFGFYRYLLTTLGYISSFENAKRGSFVEYTIKSPKYEISFRLYADRYLFTFL